MKSVSKIALGVALAFGGASLVASPAFAKKDEQKEQKGPELSKAEREALSAVQKAYEANDYAAAAAALPAAEAAAQSPDAKYFAGVFKYQIAVKTNNLPMQAEGLDEMIASGKTPADKLLTVYSQRGVLADSAGDHEKAEAAFTKVLELQPNSAEANMNLAKVKMDLKKTNEALPLIQRAIDLKRAANEQVPESWYKVGLKIAFDAHMVPQSLKFSRELIAAYPSVENWRDGLLIYRNLVNADAAMDLDTLRLMRVTKALNGERDYYQLANALSNAGLPGEAKAVLDEGVAARMIDSSKSPFKDLLANTGRQIAADKASLAGLEAKAMAAPAGKQAAATADAYLGYGEYAKAANLYRAALQKGGVDANVVNTRLGIALALAGQKAEAEAAFKAVTGPRKDLADYWLLWLSQKA